MPFPIVRARRVVGLLSAIAALSALGATAAQAAPPLDYQASADDVALTPVDTGTAARVFPRQVDDDVTTFTAPFPVTLYGATSTTLSVGSNGYVGVGSPMVDTTAVTPGNDYGTPLLAPFGVDLYTANNGGIYAETRGSSPTRQLVLEWDVVFCCDPATTARFQAIFTEGSLRVRTRYAGTVVPSNGGSTGGGVVRGFVGTIQDATTSSSFGSEPQLYPADGTGLDITPTGLTATTDVARPDGHPAVTGQALDTATDVTVSVYAGTDTTVAPVATRAVTPDATTGDFTASFAAPTDLAEGGYTVQAAQTAAGHEHVSPPQAFAVDETAPAPALTSGPTGRVSSAGVDFEGTAGGAAGDQDGTLDLYAGATATGAPVDSFALIAGDTWDVVPGSSLADGVYTAQATQADAAGNIGHSGSTTFTLDTTGPNPFFPRGAPRTGATPTFTGDAGTATGDDASVTLSVSPVGPGGPPPQQLTAPVGGDGHFAGTSAALPEGDYVVAVSQQDDLGNQGAGDTYDFTVDTTAPAPALTAPAPGTAVAGGRPVFGGTAGTAPGDDGSVTIELWAGTATTGEPSAVLEPAVAGDGTWSATPDDALAAGTYTAQVTQDDDVGNAGAGDAVTFTVPAAPAPAIATPAPVATPPEPAPAHVPVVCRSTRLLRKHVVLPAGRRVAVTATLDGKKARVVTGARAATVTVDLRGKGKGAYVLRVTTTRSGHEATTARTTYNVCARP